MRVRAIHHLMLALAAVLLAACGGGGTSVAGSGNAGNELMDEIYSPTAYTDPTAREMAEAVAAGDVTGAIQRARGVPGGLNAMAPDGTGLLLIAIERDDLRSVRLLLQAGANPDGAAGMAPVGLAVMMRNPAYLAELLRAGASPDGVLKEETALFIAAIAGLPAPITALLDTGASPEGTSGLNESAAVAAATSSNWQVVRLLLSRGADLTATTESGRTLGNLAAEPWVGGGAAEARARDAVAGEWRARGLPWPPPDRDETVRLRDAGRWPPPAGRRP